MQLDKQTIQDKVVLIPSELESIVLDLKLGGSSYKEIEMSVKEFYESRNIVYTKNEITRALEVGYDILQNVSDEIAFDIINKHLQRYEKIYKKFIELGLRDEARQVLESKEKLLGLHSSTIDFEFNNYFGNTDESLKDFDIDLLNDVEKEKMYQLINRSKNM